jgi:hypothetical protein
MKDSTSDVPSNLLSDMKLKQKFTQSLQINKMIYITVKVSFILHTRTATIVSEEGSKAVRSETNVLNKGYIAVTEKRERLRGIM